MRTKGAKEKGKNLKLLGQIEFHSANEILLPMFEVLYPRILQDLQLCLCRVRGETHPSLTCGSTFHGGKLLGRSAHLDEDEPPASPFRLSFLSRNRRRLLMVELQLSKSSKTDSEPSLFCCWWEFGSPSVFVEGFLVFHMPSTPFCRWLSLAALSSLCEHRSLLILSAAPTFYQ